MSNKNVIYICAVKILGFPFAVESKELAEEWVSKDPDSHYYDEIAVREKV